MSVGTGVFLGLLCIAAVWLYVATRGRWRWRRIALAAVAIVALPLVGFGIWVAYEDFRSSQPMPQSELFGVRIGMTKAEVTFHKGHPVEWDKTDGAQDRQRPDQWAYLDGDSSHFVTFKNDRVRSVFGIGREDQRYSVPALQGISGYSTLDDIEKKFGKPDTVSESRDHTRRIVSYNAFGVFFQLEKGTVVATGVFDPQHGPLRFSVEAAAK